MEKERFKKILNEMNKVCIQINEKTKKEEPENKLRYEVLQFSNLAKKWDSVYKIADFYNKNWLGNKDFMHIPDFEQVLYNCLSYPIIISREEDENEILGISTIKYNENTQDDIDPYFPEANAKYFSITGILVKKGTTHKGMGKKIYEIAIRSATEYSREFPETRMMCVIDCRNSHSLRALSYAVENINNNGLVGENMELPANIVGYYELRDKQNSKLEEAPTLVLEVGLNSREKTSTVNERVFEYRKNEDEPLFQTLKIELRQKMQEYGLNSPTIMQDGDCGIVYYYSLNRECALNGVCIKSNGTEEGNDRTPIYDKKMHEFIGPIRNIAIEEER